MHRIQRVGQLLAIIFSPLLLFACGNTDPAPLAPTQAAGALPSQWSEVSREARCTPPRNAPLCIEGTFAVTSQGAYRMLNSGGMVLTAGQLSATEIKTLRESADAVAAEDLGGSPSCDSVVTIVELGSIQLSIKKDVNVGPVLPVLYVQAPQRCWWGDREKAFALDDAVRILARDHAPGQS